MCLGYKFVKKIFYNPLITTFFQFTANYEEICNNATRGIFDHF